MIIIVWWHLQDRANQRFPGTPLFGNSFANLSPSHKSGIRMIQYVNINNVLLKFLWEIFRTLSPKWRVKWRILPKLRPLKWRVQHVLWKCGSQCERSGFLMANRVPHPITAWTPLKGMEDLWSLILLQKRWSKIIQKPPIFQDTQKKKVKLASRLQSLASQTQPQNQIFSNSFPTESPELEWHWVSTPHVFFQAA